MAETHPGDASAELPRRLVIPAWVRRLVVLALLAGIALRFYEMLFMPVRALSGGCDGEIYWNMATNLAGGNGLAVTDPSFLGRCNGIDSLGPSHHYSPLLPIIEAFWIMLLGANTNALVAALLSVSVAAVGVAYWTAKDLFGRDAGLLVGAAAGADWTLLGWGTRYGYAESLVFATIVLTLWAILRSLSRPPVIVWAGLFAGLGYLSKASAGWFFLLAAVGGLSWRLKHRGWGVLRDAWYLRAIGVFAVIFGLWSLRNVLLFWDGSAGGLVTAWQTSPYTSRAVAAALAQPAMFVEGLAVRTPVLLIPFILPLAFFWPEIRDAIRMRHREDVSGVLLAIGLIFVLGLLFAASFYVYENDPYYWLQPVRYVAPAAIPLLWLVVAYSGRPFSWSRWALFGVAMSLLPLVLYRFYHGAEF